MLSCSLSHAHTCTHMATNKQANRNSTNKRLATQWTSSHRSLPGTHFLLNPVLPPSYFSFLPPFLSSHVTLVLPGFFFSPSLLFFHPNYKLKVILIIVDSMEYQWQQKKSFLFLFIFLENLFLFNNLTYMYLNWYTMAVHIHGVQCDMSVPICDV